MRKELNFVKGAVARKDFLPELTHFNIKDGRITGFNGDMALSAPIATDIKAKPHAATFIKAVNACEQETALSVTKTGRLSLKSGKFRALIDCLPEDHPVTPILPDGKLIDLGETFFPCIKALAPFMGVDASRPWATGIMLKSGSALATNNICMVEYWHGTTLPFEINIPKSAIIELLRINETPTKIQMTQHSISFHFEGGRWLRSQLLATNWPDVSRVFEQVNASVPVAVPAGLFEGLEKIKPFIDEGARVFFGEAGLATSHDPEAATTVDIDGLPAGPCFNHAMLSLLNGTAKKIDFSNYPRPCKFEGEKLRGVILGLNY